MKISYLFLLLFGFALAFSSCDKDDPEPVLGCTDENAENYNAAATQNDNSCVFARDKFLGEFNGTLNCGAIITMPTAFRMIISEGLGGDNEVQVEFKDTDVPFPIVSATVEGNMLTITESQYNIEYQGFPVDVKIIGESTISEDETTLDGTLALDFVTLPITDNCAFQATR